MAYNIFDLDPYRALCIQVWENHKPSTGRFIVSQYMSMAGEMTIRIPAYEDKWAWTLRMSEWVALDDEREPGWVGCKATLLSDFGEPYGAPRPQLIYMKPWVYPSHMIWPDGWRGPLSVAMWVASSTSDLSWLRRTPEELTERRD